MAKPAVQGVIWNQLRDNQPHDFPHGGLFDALIGGDMNTGVWRVHRWLGWAWVPAAGTPAVRSHPGSMNPPHPM